MELKLLEFSVKFKFYDGRGYILMVEAKERRVSKPKKRVLKKERRESMLIISSASQSDIYIWAFSIALMVGVLTTMIMLSTFGG